MTTAKIHPVDVHVGRNIRFVRNFRGLSLEQLAKQIGVSYQQLQKYEEAQNRVSASRMDDIAAVLGVAPSIFFEGLQKTPSKHTSRVDFLTAMLRRPDEIDEKFMSDMGMLFRVADDKTRQRLIQTMKSMADAAPKDLS